METLGTELLRDLTLVVGSGLLTFLIAIISAPLLIKLLKRFQFGQKIREATVDGKSATIFNELHKKKEGTPSMGGIVIWGSILVTVLISQLFPYLGWTNYTLWERAETYVPLFTLISFGLLGLVDDIFNVKGIGAHKGLKAKTKFIWLILLSTAGGYWFYERLGRNSIDLGNLFGGDFTIGWWYIPLFVLVIIACSNAVNITDGLDGLAGGLSVMAFGALAIVSYFQGLAVLAALCAVIAGACLGFLWFNIPPAAFFMGDTGSLALGATMGVVAMTLDNILLLLFITFIFIIETLSVIIQLSSKKFLGRKVFKIAPIHHHFEAIGWPEFRVTMRFWIIGATMMAFGLILHFAQII